jgi:4-amino-4-deoxy-L-arabinose transferase-like glycosyltransferase
LASPLAAWLVSTLGLSIGFGTLAAYNLANYRPVTNDEVELMAVSYKLATHGVLGSDLFAGFFGAEQHWLITLPVQHLLQALAFRLFGTGVAEARWVSLVAGVSIVWSVGWLAYRWYGLGTATISELLLVAWPSNVTAASNGLPLLGVARAARYDVLAVAFAWLALVLLDATLRRPRRLGGLGIGICCGLATLSQFMGAFVLPLVVLNWLWARGRRAFADQTLFWILAGTALVVAPWLAYAAQYPTDLAGQLTVFGGRGDFLRPGFYLENVVSEGSRYGHLLDPDVGSAWILALGIGPAVAYAAWRSRRRHATGERVVWSSLVTFSGLLLLLDQTKASLYAIVLLPSVCVALASLWTGVLGWTWSRGEQAWLRLAAGALTLGLSLVITVDGVRAYHLTFTQARQVSRYLGVGEQIERVLAPGARVLGAERWWWALHNHPYLSLRNVWWQWSAADGRTPTFVDGASWADADSVVVNDNVRADVLLFPEAAQRRFWTFLRVCTTRVADLTDATYFDIQVYRVTKPAPESVCG